MNHFPRTEAEITAGRRATKVAYAKNKQRAQYQRNGKAVTFKADSVKVQQANKQAGVACA